MDQIIDFVSQNWFGFVSGVAIAAGAGIWFRPISRLSCQKAEFTVVGGPTAEFADDMEIWFRGSKVDRVTSTRIFLWNSGNQTIKGDQVVESDPLRVEVGLGAEILKIDTLAIPRPANGVKIRTPGAGCNMAGITFDYLDSGDGVTFEIIHSGAEKSVAVKGTIQGIRCGVTTRPDLDRLGSRGPLLDKIAPTFMATATLVMMIPATVIFPWWATSIIALLAMVGVILIWGPMRRFPKSLIPRPPTRSQGGEIVTRHLEKQVAALDKRIKAVGGKSNRR